MILVFDLDDTLYDEITFVHSGFNAVAEMLSKEYLISVEELFNHMLYELKQVGRGKVFDNTLLYYNIYSKKNVNKCISTYRLHFPSIYLPLGSKKCLESFINYPKYLVTDGNKIVQGNKIKALGIANYFKRIFITHRFGVKNSKPSPYCFLQICRLEKVLPLEVVYIGDNPHKDFVGIKPLGFKTIRVRQGMFKEIHLSQQYEADVEVTDLSELYSAINQLHKSSNLNEYI